MDRTTALLPQVSLRAFTSSVLHPTRRHMARVGKQAGAFPPAGGRWLAWLGVGVLYVGTSMLAAGFLAQRALANAYGGALAGLDSSGSHLAGGQAPVAVWWVPETMSGFMIALALMLLGLGLLAADGDRKRCASYGE